MALVRFAGSAQVLASLAVPAVIYFNLIDEEIVLLVAVYAKAGRETMLPQGRPKAGVMNIEKIAKAIETDAGEPLPDLRQALDDAKARVARVTSPEQMLVRQAREPSGMSQSTFAERMGTPVATLRDWEQGRFASSGAVLCLLRLIIKHPELTAEHAA